MDCEKNPFLDMSQDQIQKIEAVLQSEQAKELLQASSDVVKLFDNSSKKEALDSTPRAEEEHLPILDASLEAGLSDLQHVFEQDSGQVLFTGESNDAMELTTELLHDDFNEPTMDPDLAVILMDHCYTTFPEDLLKKLQSKQEKNESPSKEISSVARKETILRSNITSLRRSQRQLDKFQREQVEKIKAENAELQRREKEEMEKRKAQAGNILQKGNQIIDKNIDITFLGENPNKKEIIESSQEKLSSDVSPSKKDKNARKSIQQKKLPNCDDDDRNLNDIVNKEEEILPPNETDNSQKEEIIENIVADINNMEKQTHSKKLLAKKKKKQLSSDSSDNTHRRSDKTKMKRASPNKIKDCKDSSTDRIKKQLSDSDDQLKDTKNNKDLLNSAKDDKINVKIKGDSKLQKLMRKPIKKLQARRESSVSLPDEPALFSQPDVMVKRKASVEETDIRKDKTVNDNSEENKTDPIDTINVKTTDDDKKEKISSVKTIDDDKKEKISSELDKKQVKESTSIEMEQNCKLLDTYLLNDNSEEKQLLLSSLSKTEKLNSSSEIVLGTKQLANLPDVITKDSKAEIKSDKKIREYSENRKVETKHAELKGNGQKQFNKHILNENKEKLENLQKKDNSREKFITTSQPLKEKVLKQSSQESVTDDHLQKEKEVKPIQHGKIVAHDNKNMNDVSLLKEKKLNNQNKAPQETRKSKGEKSQGKEKLQKEGHYQKIIQDSKKIHQANNVEMAVKKLHMPDARDEQVMKVSSSSQNKIQFNSSSDIQEKKHYTRFSTGKIKGNKYIKLLTGKGFSDDLENQEEEEGEEEDDDPEKLWCICRQPYDERFMIQCDSCEDWFHGNCVGVTQQQGRQLERSKQEWWCPKCLEGMTDDFLQVLNSGNRTSVIPKQSKERIKPEKLNSNISSVHRIPAAASVNKTNTSVKKQKEPPANESSKPAPSQNTDIKNDSKPNLSPIKKEANGPEPVRLNVRNTLKGILISRCNDANDIDAAENDIKCIADCIEEELYKLFKDTGSKYKSKYRSLMFNIKDPRNQGLYRKIVKGIITPEHLVKMTPEELASTELAKWRERESKHMLEMIKREQIEQQQAALTQVIKKTHKGEVEVDDDSKIPEQKSLKQLPEEAPELIMDTTDKHRSHLFDLNCKICTGKMAPPTEDKSVKKVRIAHAISKEEHNEQEQVPVTTTKIKPKVAEESDDDGGEQEVSSTLRSPDSTVASYFTSPTSQTSKNVSSVWKGFIAMQDIAKFVTTAHNVSGATETLEQDIPDSIQVCGRIVPEQVWDYLTKIKQSVNKDIIVIRFAPASDEEKTPYGTLYSYLNSRKRYGVVGNCSRMIKDFYIMPLASYTPVPTVLMPFKGPGLDSARPNLLIGVIVRHASKPRQSANQSRVSKTSKAPERSYTPPLEMMPSSSDESMSQTSTKSSAKRTPLSDEYEPYEPSFTPPLEKMPKLDCDDTSQNKDLYEDKPYDPEDDNFVTGVSQSMQSVTPKVLNEVVSSDTLERDKRLLMELTKKVEEEKQQIEKSLKLTNTSLIGNSCLPSQSPIPQKYKLESETEMNASVGDMNAYQIPGLGDGWPLTSEMNTSTNFTPSGETSSLHVQSNPNNMLCTVNESPQNPIKREDEDLKCVEATNGYSSITSNNSSLEVQQGTLGKEQVADSQMTEHLKDEDYRQKPDGPSAPSKSTSKGSLSSMSASELLLKAQEQLEEMENAQKLQDAQTNYWTAVQQQQQQQQTQLQCNVISPEQLDLPSYSSNSYPQNISEHYLSHTENHFEHYIPTSESHSGHYSSHSDHQSFHYEEHSNNHNQRYYSREHRANWNQQSRNPGRYHRYRRKHWTPSSVHHHHKHKGWYHSHDGNRR